jgi:hypothetical protein
MSEHVEKWRLRCVEWLDLQKAADLLRETKNDVFAQITSSQPGKSNAEKERHARCSTEWEDFRNQMIDAEHKARVARMRLKYEQMCFEAWRSEGANARKERDRY